MTVYNWLTVKLLYHSSITAWQYICFSPGDINFFVTSVFRESLGCFCQSISQKFDLTKM